MVKENKIKKLMRPGDYIYSTNNGKPLKVIEVNVLGLKTEEDFFFYEEHGKLFFLSEVGYRKSLVEGKNV